MGEVVITVAFNCNCEALCAEEYKLKEKKPACVPPYVFLCSSYDIETNKCTSGCDKYNTQMGPVKEDTLCPYTRCNTVGCLCYSEGGVRMVCGSRRGGPPNLR